MTTSRPGSPLSIERFNQDCMCLSLDPNAMATALAAELGEAGGSAQMADRWACTFSAQPVFVGAEQLQRIARIVQAIESVVALPAYRERVLAEAPATARVASVQAQGALLGFDFHLEREHLSLIEINTNAGGAMLNAVLARAQRSCCESMEGLVPTPASVDLFEQRLVDMFRREWHLPNPQGRRLERMVIVDDAPEQQFLYPEFLLFRRLFQRHGIEALIADPSELAWRDGRLWLGDAPIDLVYNRLTDFYLEDPAHAVLRTAWMNQAVVLTPHPHAHALYADKRRLALLSDEQQLQQLGVPDDVRELLRAHVPVTEVVAPASAERLWAQRRGLFFKPTAGYGSRAAYRGDKLTRRVWNEILGGAYVAQALRMPGERRIRGDEGPLSMKFDLRAYAYAGQVLWMAARLYQGQTTNFRSPGGGFAPVYSAQELPTSALCQADERVSYTFLLDEQGTVHPLAHAIYVALARGQASAPTLAGQTLRLVDWYVQMRQGKPFELLNETYASWRINAQGQVEMLHARPEAAWPTHEERDALKALVFDPQTACGDRGAQAPMAGKKSAGGLPAP